MSAAPPPPPSSTPRHAGFHCFGAKPTRTRMEPESMEVDSTKDNRLEPEEKQDSAVEKETTEEDHSTAAESDEQCDMSSAGVGVVIMDGDLTPSEIIDIDKSVSEQQCSEGNDIQDQEGNNDEQANPLSTADEQENTDKPELEADAVEMSSAEESNSEGNCLVSKVTENDTSLDKQSVVSSSGERSEVTETQEGETCSGDADGNAGAGADADATQKASVESIVVGKEDDNEDIVELPVHRKPAVLVDLSDDDENVDKNQKKKQNKECNDDLSVMEDKAASNESKKIKLRSLASLVDVAGGDDVPHPDIPGIGEIVEHGVIIGSEEMDGLQLRISNVVGGEDCITGLTVDEDRDAFSSIQISSVTTLIDPISPEDPNQIDNSDENHMVDEENEKEIEENLPCRLVSSTSTAEPQSSSAGTAASDSVDLTKDDGKKSAEKNDDSSETEKSSNRKDLTDSGSAGPKIRLSTAATEVGKDAGSKDESSPPRHVYHILRSILTVKRECVLCSRNVQCQFRIVKKDENGTWAFLCSTSCRAKWTSGLMPNHVVEKPRLIFEKLCGMCGKDLASLARDGQYSWETREFCSKDCLTQHLNEVAGVCHMCHEKVRLILIGKYCVRFGSDIHQFCSNHCLECYKTKIKVCCYCQKNLETVAKVTSISNKEYCSSKCLKRAQRRDIGQQNHTDQYPCTVCQIISLNRYEFVTNQESYQLCSDPCLNVYKYANKVKAVPCCLCFRVMNAEDVAHYLYHGGHQLRVFCSDSCVNVFILSARKIVVCEACKVKKYNFDMIHRQVDEDFRDYFFCSLNCLDCKEPIVNGKKSKNGGTAAASPKSGSVTSNVVSDQPVTNCNMCNAMAKAQYHMVMSDNTLRSFCRYACASKYKNTFGFQVNGIQSSDSSENSNSVPVLREKVLQKTPSSQPEEPENTSQTKKKIVCDAAEDVSSVTAELLRLLTPPTMVNKTTSCRPHTTTKGVYCKPHPWHRQTQTESSDTDSKAPAVLPVPVPIYVPTPMMTYSMPYPVPVFVPIPLPVPIFIPTTARTTTDIAKMMNKIQDEMPEDPYEAEMVMLARASSESIEAETPAEKTQKNPSPPTACENPAVIDELKDVDVSCLDTVEDDIPRLSLKPSDATNIVNSMTEAENVDSEEEGEEQNRKKRKLQHEDGNPKKKMLLSGSHEPASVSDPEREPQSTSSLSAVHLEEEYPDTFLNKMYGLAAWKSWVTTKNAELAGVSSSRNMKMICDDLLSMNCEELNYALCLFLKDLRKKNGELYQPDTVFYLLLGIQQHLFDSARTDCIFMDLGFEKFTNSFDEITRTFVSQSLPSDGECSSSSSTPGVTRITESMLWECRQLGAHTPQVLLNTLFYFNTKVFKLKTVEEHQGLSFSHIVKQWRRTVVDPEGSVMRTSLLKYFCPKKDGKKKKAIEMHENRDDPLRCPVKLFEFYLSKCPECLRHEQAIYYVYPERSCVPDSPTWFSNQAVQQASLSKMLHRTLMVKEIQEALME
ncbi:zinc finger MYM-type protein 3-like isoform X2 [Portunus trituberculatus]|uniref:zinc finger MYM-type protein 3-like isoform X2 n=1 Tax=Portunus trituberculatus TaxID=210409 RepID=UPI001E1CCAB8|nr:zinc finger MYM-type protein 3-like isoform X2 [Portunus trituberculatus]